MYPPLFVGGSLISIPENFSNGSVDSVGNISMELSRDNKLDEDSLGSRISSPKLVHEASRDPRISVVRSYHFSLSRPHLCLDSIFQSIRKMLGLPGAVHTTAEARTKIRKCDPTAARNLLFL